jgi:NADPH:quinone reductase-like Zn-dependent oxidoreductase
MAGLVPPIHVLLNPLRKSVGARHKAGHDGGLVMDFSGKRVVITGGTGALGSAVAGLLLEAGAACIVPYIHDGEMEHFAHRGNGKVTLLKVSDLANEADVA